MTASASVVVPVGLLNEAAGLLELEGYGPVSMGLLACLTHPAEQGAREAVDPIDERTGHPTSYSHPPLTQAAPDGWVLVPVMPDEAMLDAARGLIMSLSFNAPNHKTSLADVAESGFYGELWRHILTDDEKAMAGPITKGHRAQLIYRAMLSASPAPPAQGAGG